MEAAPNQNRDYQWMLLLEQYHIYLLEFDRVAEQLRDAQAASGFPIPYNLLALTVQHRALQVVLVDVQDILADLDPDRFHAEFEANDMGPIPTEPNTELDSSEL